MINQAFDTKTIIETRAASLRSKAILETRALTEWGICYIKNADDIRYNPETQAGEIRAAGQWIPLLDAGVEIWAYLEGLDWRKPDGTIIHHSESSGENGRPPIVSPLGW